jgi:hypothetical protein
MRFAYTPMFADPSPANPTGVIFRPELRVVVSGTGSGASEQRIIGIVDPGATECILPLGYAEQVGAELLNETAAMFDYAGRPHTVQYGRVRLRFRLKDQSVRWTTAVAFDPDRKETALWGRYGFLNYFNVTFHGRDQIFTIRLRPPWPAGFEVVPVPVSPSERRRKRSDLITPADQAP